MSSINVTNLSFSYDYKNIFENVSFTIDTDWKLGFIGRNGKGKTTFLKLLLGKYEYKGKISTSVDFEYFPFEVKEKQKTTIDIVYEIVPDIEIWKLNRELNLLKVDEDVLYKQFNLLSNGEQTKVLLAVLFLKENNFLLIDEPTNHLDTYARECVSNYLNKKKGFILVSHDRSFIDNSVDHILSINNTNIEVRQGNYSSWKENKDRQDNFELRENEKLKADIDKLQKASKRTEKWSDKVEASKIGAADKGYIGHLSAKMMKTSKVIERRSEKQIDEKSKLLKNIDRMDSLTIKPLVYDKQNLITVYDLGIKYNEKLVFGNISFTMNVGDRIAILGKNGSGKSSILKLIIGEKIDYFGTLNIGNDIKISYVKQDTSDLCGNLKEFVRINNIDESIFKAMLNKLGVESSNFDKDIKDFSEGQKKKVLIAKSISESAHLYIWDEPLNFIDITSRVQIEEAILKYMPTMIFVEHDKAFCDNIATKIVDLNN